MCVNYHSRHRRAPRQVVPCQAFDFQSLAIENNRKPNPDYSHEQRRIITQVKAALALALFTSFRRWNWFCLRSEVSYREAFLSMSLSICSLSPAIIPNLSPL
jgi:hypothetical protein